MHEFLFIFFCILFGAITILLPRNMMAHGRASPFYNKENIRTPITTAISVYFDSCIRGIILSDHSLLKFFDTTERTPCLLQAGDIVRDADLRVYGASYGKIMATHGRG